MSGEPAATENLSKCVTLGVGNESWGCGGNFTPEEYAAEKYRRFTEVGFKIWNRGLLYRGGSEQRDLDWSRRFFTK
jgi:alpha-N-arabinofuranosidase